MYFQSHGKYSVNNGEEYCTIGLLSKRSNEIWIQANFKQRKTAEPVVNIDSNGCIFGFSKLEMRTLGYEKKGSKLVTSFYAQPSRETILHCLVFHGTTSFKPLLATIGTTIYFT